jgi:hypothetical protein
MNERIRSLIERAEYQVGKQYGPDWEVYVEPSREQILEKFAELIVKECAEVCRLKYARADAWSKECSLNFSKDVLNHFGVEE